MADFRAYRRVALALMVLIVPSGCAFEPRETDDERQRLDTAGTPYAEPFEQRQIADLPQKHDWRDVLQRAFVANGDLEAAYMQWQIALHRVEGAAEWPNSRVAVGFDYMFSDEKMKSWDRTTVSVGFDPSMMLQLPNKVAKRAEVALAEAQVAGHRFAAAKFDLQQRVLTAWWDYALMAEQARIQQEQLGLLRMLSDSAAQRIRSGGAQQDLLKADTAYELAENDLVIMQSRLTAMRAMLNGMLARPADAPLSPPHELPEARPIPAGDDVLIAAAVDHNPDLAILAREVAGRTDAIELAKMAYIPDIAPQFSLTGSVSQAVGTMVTLPTTLREIRASIHEARAMLRGSEAMLRQTGFDRSAQFVATLVALRDSERQVALFEQSILGKARQVLGSSQFAYSTGAVGFEDLIDSQRVLLDIRLMVAEARIAREKRLVELERLAGLDIETLAQEGEARLATKQKREPNHD